MRQYFGITLLAGVLMAAAFAQSPAPSGSPSPDPSGTPTPEPTDSPSPDPSESPSPTPTITAVPTDSPSPYPTEEAKICCVRVYKKQYCMQGSASDTDVALMESAASRAFMPNDPPQVETYPITNSNPQCPEKNWSVKWELTGSTCNVSNWLHFKTWTRLVHISNTTEAECQLYEDLPSNSNNQQEREAEDLLNQTLRTLIENGR